MKAELRLRPHAILPDAHTIEVWHGGRWVCTVAGADGPGVNIISRFPIKATPVTEKFGLGLHAIQVLQEATPEGN